MKQIYRTFLRIEYSVLCACHSLKLCTYCFTTNTEAVYCPALTPPDNGTVSISSGVNYLSVGSTATYSCDPGYALLGSTTRTCEDPDRDSVGTWTGSMPNCQGNNSQYIPTGLTLSQYNTHSDTMLSANYS